MLKLIIGILLFLLILTNAWWFYRAMDQTSILKYVELEKHDLQNRIDILKPIAEIAVVGLSQSEAEHLLGRIKPDVVPFTKEGHVNSVGISLRLDNSGLVDGIR